MPQETTHSIQITGVLLKEASAWVAQGLEYDIAAQGKTIRDAMRAFRQTLIGQIVIDVRHGRQPFANIPKAPDFYWEKYDEGESLADNRQPLHLPKDLSPQLRSAEVELKVA
jgi:hypothetical protein